MSISCLSHVYLNYISCLGHFYPCLAHVLLISRSFLSYVYLMSIMSWSRLSHVSVMSQSCLFHVSVISISYLAHVYVMSMSCLSHVYLMSCSYLNHVSLMFRSCLVPGLSLTQVDAGGDGFLVGTTGSRAYCLRTAYARSFKGAGSVSWTALPAYTLKYFSCGLYGCWGVDTIGRVYHTRVRSSSSS